MNFWSYFANQKIQFKSFFFAKIDGALYKPVRLMHGLGSALCFITIKILSFLFNELYTLT